MSRLTHKDHFSTVCKSVRPFVCPSHFAVLSYFSSWHAFLGSIWYIDFHDWWIDWSVDRLVDRLMWYSNSKCRIFAAYFSHCSCEGLQSYLPFDMIVGFTISNVSCLLCSYLWDVWCINEINTDWFTFRLQAAAVSMVWRALNWQRRKMREPVFCAWKPSTIWTVNFP